MIPPRLLRTGTDPLFWAFFRSSLLVACGLVTLNGCGEGRPKSDLLQDETAATKAVKAIEQKVGYPIRALNLVLTEDRLTVQIQDPAKPQHVDEWSFDQIDVLNTFRFENISGPKPVELNLINPRLEENLFNLSEVDFRAVSQLAQTAVKKVGLEDGGKVIEMELSGKIFLLPAAHSGDVEWTISVKSPRESATAYANAQGRITHLNLDGTMRAKMLNLLEGGSQLDEVIGSIRELFGGTNTLKKVELAGSGIAFLAKDLQNPQKLSWYRGNLNGVAFLQEDLQPESLKTLGVGDAAGGFFGMDDVDWRALGQLKKTALQQLGMPNGSIQSIKISKPPQDFGSAFVAWEVEGRDQNGEKGSVVFDAKANVKQVTLPESRRPKLDLLSADGIRQVLLAIKDSLGSSVRIMELDFRNDLQITTAEPNPNGPLGGYSYREGKLKHDADALVAQWQSWHYKEDWLFDLSELGTDTAQLLTGLEAKTLDRFKLPGGKIERITISKNKLSKPQNKNVLYEVRVEGDRSRSGWVIYDTRGTVVEVTAP
jgi:hypothetical protein